MIVIPKIRERMAWIHRILIAPPEETNLNHFDKQLLEDEYEELQLQEEETCSRSTKHSLFAR